MSHDARSVGLGLLPWTQLVATAIALVLIAALMQSGLTLPALPSCTWDVDSITSCLRH